MHKLKPDIFYRWGAQSIAREDFLKLLDQALEVPTIIGNWKV